MSQASFLPLTAKLAILSMFVLTWIEDVWKTVQVGVWHGHMTQRQHT